MFKTLCLLAALCLFVTLSGLAIASFAGLPLACAPLLGAATLALAAVVNA